MDELTSEQLAEWEAYSQLEPIGEWRADWRTALLCTTITNIFKSFGSKKGSTPKWSTLDEFMPPWDDAVRKKPAPVKEQTVEEMKAALIRIAKVMGPKQKLDDKKPPKRLRK